jgi:hypothetical protein
MNMDKDSDQDNDFKLWVKPLLDAAVSQLMNNNVLGDAKIEARAVWGITEQVFIAQVREYGEQVSFHWLISGGDFPVDEVSGNVAELPRDAARHFSLKWQLGAEQVRNMDDETRNRLSPGQDTQAMSERLRLQAEILYELVEDNSIW